MSMQCMVCLAVVAQVCELGAIATHYRASYVVGKCGENALQ